MLTGKCIIPYRESVIALLIVFVSSAAYSQVFQDDFAGNLSKWRSMGNAGSNVVENGELVSNWGSAPSWFVTNQTFNFGTDPVQFNFTFVQGGHQATANYKQNWIQPLLGANNPDGDNGAVRARFSADYFELERRSADGSWSDIPFVGDAQNVTVDPGDRVRFEIDSSGQKGVMFVNGQTAVAFQANALLSGSVGFRVVLNTRNVIVDDVRFSQIDSSGAETVILNDAFDRAALGSNWVNETLAANSAPGPLTAAIQNGALHLTNDGSGDAWLRINADAAFQGKTTVFEYTFIDYIGGNTWRPTPVLGVKPYQSGTTSGVLLIDNGSGINWGMVNGGWSQGQAVQIGGNRQGMRVRIVVNPGGQSGAVYRDGVKGISFFNIGPAFSGAFALRHIVNRDATIDDVRVYTIEPNGSETTLFEDNFNRTTLGNDWVLEALTPDAPPGAVFTELGNFDNDADNELRLDHDGTLDDEWFRLNADLPFGGDKPVVVELTFAAYTGLASMVIGTNQFSANLFGPILLDDMSSPWVMDTRGGNVWVRPGPVGGSNISLRVNANGSSGSFLVNDVIIRDWEFAAGQAPIPVGSVGFEDPFTATTANASPPAPAGTFALARYDNVSVSTAATNVAEWMIH